MKEFQNLTEEETKGIYDALMVIAGYDFPREPNVPFKEEDRERANLIECIVIARMALDIEI